VRTMVWRDVPDPPPPGPGEILVRIEVSDVQYVDVLMLAHLRQLGRIIASHPQSSVYGTEIVGRLCQRSSAVTSMCETAGIRRASCLCCRLIITTIATGEDTEP
jgi:NADPH:quinone reductase-like Zn-dependent oxidoreductase